MRKWVAVGALGVYAATALSTAWDVSDNRPLSLLSCAFAAVLVAAAGGVVRERMWARLLALGAGFTGLTNAAVFFARWAPGHPSTYDNILFGLLSLALVGSLAGRSMAALYTRHLPASSVWRRHHDPRVRLLAAAVITGVASSTMLLIFGAVLGEAVMVTVAAAVFTSVSALLVLAERAAGVILLGAGSVFLGLIGMELAQFAFADFTRCGGLRMAASFAQFTFPVVAAAAVSSGLAFAAFGRTLLRFVLRPAD